MVTDNRDFGIHELSLVEELTKEILINISIIFNIRVFIIISYEELSSNEKTGLLYSLLHMYTLDCDLLLYI